MQVLMTGAAGMIGVKLTQRLLRDAESFALSSLLLHDVVPSELPSADASPVSLNAITSDLTGASEVDRLVADRPAVIFHLAAVVSGEAEADFDKGYRVNLDGTRSLFEAIRRVGDGYRPRVVFASSLAVFGAPFEDVIRDDFFLTPLTSYGTQKAICELLLSDYSRRGFLDGVGVRLPTICVRPGKPNKAASGFFSNIIREPLNGEEAVLPVPDETRNWFASPRAAIDFLTHAATISTEPLGHRRNLSMPGVAASVAEQIMALRKVAGDNVVRRIRREPDEAIARIASGWPHQFDARCARELGFEAESSFEEIIRAHIDDELHGEFAA